MHYAVFKLRDGDKGYVTQNFLHSFKMNIKQSTILWIIVALIGAVLYADFLILFRSTYNFSIILKVFTGLVAFIYSLTVVFIFPLQARFDNTVRQTKKNSFLMGMFHLPKTVLIISQLMAQSVRRGFKFCYHNDNESSHHKVYVNKSIFVRSYMS